MRSIELCILSVCCDRYVCIVGDIPESGRTRQQNELLRSTVMGQHLSSGDVQVAYKELHLRDLLVHFLHKLDDEIHQLVFQHLLGVEVGDEEGDIITLSV